MLQVADSGELAGRFNLRLGRVRLMDDTHVLDPHIGSLARVSRYHREAQLEQVIRFLSAEWRATRGWSRGHPIMTSWCSS
jgi:hypothetical protein